MCLRGTIAALELMSMQTEMKSYYSARASYYDAVYEKPERKNDIGFLSRFLPERLAGRDVVEVACGTGFWSQFIAPGCRHYIATDGVAEPLVFAKQRLDGVCDQICIADAYALPITLGRFNGAFAGLWFSHVPVQRRSEFIHSLHALLVPESRVILIDNSEVQLRDFPIEERDAFGNTYQHRPLRDGNIHRVLKNFPTDIELFKLGEEFGWKHCQFKSLENFWVFEYELPRTL